MRALSKRAVHVYLADPHHVQSVQSCTRRAVPSAERSRDWRDFTERDQAIYVATHWLARTVLSEYEPIAPGGRGAS